jgi:hypothetical protein
MATFIRYAGAVGFLSLLTSGALAASSIESAFNLPQWAEPCSLPSVTANSSIIQDSAVQLASNDQPAPDNASNNATSPSCNDCDACNACNLGCSCCNQWYVSAGAVILHRNRPDAGAILNPVGPGISVGAGDYDFGWNGGPDITVGRQIDCCNSWEVRYFNDLGASASSAFSFGVTDFRIATGAPVNVIGLTTADDTDLHSAEFNLRHKLNDYVTFLSGFRYVELEDSLRYDLDLGPFSSLYTWHETTISTAAKSAPTSCSGAATIHSNSTPC